MIYGKGVMTGAHLDIGFALQLWIMIICLTVRFLTSANTVFSFRLNIITYGKGFSVAQSEERWTIETVCMFEPGIGKVLVGLFPFFFLLCVSSLSFG